MSNTSALIKETLKYLEKDKSGKAKYRFEIYNSGIARYYNDQISKLSFGLIPKVANTGEEEEAKPVSVYTIGDLFDTVANVKEDVMSNIQALPGTIDNIKVSLKQLGFTALDNLLNTVKAAVIPIEVIQTVESVYRIAKPLVEKIVNIASIKFYFENAALVAQDVLQYLSRIAVSTARNFLDNLWNILLDTPVFAIYENDDTTVNLAEVHAELSGVAESALNRFMRDAGFVYDMIEYINSGDFTTYEPGYGDFSGINLPNNRSVIDIYSDPNTRRIYVASSRIVFTVNKDYTTSQLFTAEGIIYKIYIYNGIVHYLTYDSSQQKYIIKRWVSNNTSGEIETVGSISTNEDIDIIFSNPIILLVKGTNEIYDGEGNPISQDVLHITDNIKYHCYDIDNDVIYYISTSNKLWQITSVEDDNGFVYYYPKKIYDFEDDTPYGLRYFNNILYIIKKKDELYYLTKINAGVSFNRNDYSYDENFTGEIKNIIWTDGKYATDGSNIFEIKNKNKLYYRYSIDSTNCVSEFTYNSNTYIICTSGTKIYIAKKPRENSEPIKWYEKTIDTTTYDDESPDNIAGHFWYKNSYGNNFVVYSQRRIYVFGPSDISKIFELVDTRTIPALLNKEFASFESWFTDNSEQNVLPPLVPTSKTDISENCLITTMKVIGGTIYAALFNPLVSSRSDNGKDVASGIYKCSISKISGNFQFVIDYQNYIFSADNKTRIYSFNKKDEEFYYIDSDKLYNITTHSATDLKLKEFSDGALLIDDDINIYTSKALLESSQIKAENKLNSLVNYESKDLPEIAATRNTFILFDGTYAYNIVDNGEDEINSDMFQICYRRLSSGESVKLIQSNDSIFFVSNNKIIKKLPFYSSIDSCEYGCGYYVDTAPNKWHSAAPYYFASNVLNSNKNKVQRDLFLFNFRENFKVELQKLLIEMPDAFIAYMEKKVRGALNEANISIDGDDGQIINIIKDSVAETTATSFAMYVREKFMQRIGNDDTYETFASAVYSACKADTTNNMTKQFYDIFVEFANSIIKESIIIRNLGRDGMSKALLRYYQNHKAEWAKSMTDLIDVDIVDPDIYEMPLKNTQTLEQKTYRFSYNENKYKFEFIPNPSADFLDENIIKGYYYEGKFYYDPEHTQEIDPRQKDSEGNYVDGSGNIICFYDVDTMEYYRYKLMDYVETKDETVVSDKDYYEKTGDDTYTYSLTEDTEEKNNKMYFSKILSPSSDVEVAADKEYFSKSDDSFEYEQTTEADYGGEYTYNVSGDYFEYNPTGSNRFFVTFIPFAPDPSRVTYSYDPTTDTSVEPGKTYYELIEGEYREIENPTGNPSEQGWYEYVGHYSGSLGNYIYEDGYYKYIENPTGEEKTYVVATYKNSTGILKLGSYFVNEAYVPTNDTEVISGKKYYTESFVKATGEIPLSDVQYYEYQYVPTTDTEIVPNKGYFEYFSFSDQMIREYGYIKAPDGSTAQRYKKIFEEYNGTFDSRVTYYKKDEDGNYVEAMILDPEQGPYYYVAAMETAVDGDYIKATPETFPTEHYNWVQNPTIDKLPTYYERSMVAIATPDTLDDKYVKSYILVNSPVDSQISTYYEKEKRMVPAQNVNYARDEFGTVVGIVDDRNFYKAIFTTGNFIEIEEPTGNPYNQGWYEYAYTQILPGTILNPMASGLYERSSNDIAFTKVENPTGNPREQGWYEYIYSYSNIYDDGKVYINLDPITVESDFPELDDEWHNMFYDRLDEIAAEASLKETIEEAKQFALDAVNKIDYKFQPDWKWKSLITQSVVELYIPAQGDQYRTIVLDSNMYPIQWNELPADIDGEAFDYALTALLYAIKQRLITNIAILVDNGKIKCYSCVDASSVIKKIIDRNAGIWFKQGKRIKANIENATNKDELVAAIKVIKSFDPTLYLLENILNDQSKLYAKYIDRIIEEQVINDNDTEVMLND